MIEAKDRVGEELAFNLKDVLKVIARKGVSDILYSLERSPKRFSQLMFDTQLNPSILDRHLKALIQLDLITKEDGLYRLTEIGDKVVTMIEDLLSLFKEKIS
ncbi:MULTISPECIES: ArsR family transcriptional regulator [unclassified Archaeoglobus]|jgi:DNA-binding HxlR family transcriptional regulator|uniref:ArsR family transcriptional regulator n=1 Tax=unclassified Archaeoglobus TaxID=2643606 RepID=UPI0025B7E2F1|nr:MULTISPECIES: ArsR family transcriptional regulator [unclassified Archaeoglobus]